MRCLKCGAASGSPRISGLTFYTRGSDQSDVYSPGAEQADYEHLRIFICDACMRGAGAGEAGTVEHGQSYPPLGTPLPGEWKYRRWRLPPPAGRDDD